MSERGREPFIDSSTGISERTFFIPSDKGISFQQKRIEAQLERCEIPAECVDEWLLDFYEQRTRLKTFMAWQQSAQMLLGQLDTTELLDYHTQGPYGRFLYNDSRDSSRVRCFTLRLDDLDRPLINMIDHFQLQLPYVVDEPKFRQAIFDAYYEHGVKITVTPADIIPPETSVSVYGFWIDDDYYNEWPQHNLKLQPPTPVLERGESKSVIKALARAEYEAQRAEAAAHTLARSIFVHDAGHTNTNDPLERLFTL